jgi:hypothetical protein
LYDFFSYTVPGVLYILVLNRFLAAVNLPSLDLTRLNVDLGSTLLWVVASYVTGQLMDSFAIRWYYLINKFHAETRAMKEFREKHKGMVIDFTINDRQTLFSVVRHNNLELARHIDNFKAISIMLNNISLALLLLALQQVLVMAMRGVSLGSLLILIVSALFCYVAILRSALFNEWHWAAVYQHARQYGKSVAEMFKSKGGK